MRAWILIFFLLSGTFAQAQKFSGEILGGAVGSQVSGDQLSGFNKAGIIAGGGVRTGLGENTSLGFRILYFQKGSRKPSKLDQGDPSYYRLRLNYIEVPVLLRFGLIKNFYAEAGISAGYLISSSEEDEDGELPLRKPFEKIDLSGALLLGYPVAKSIDFQLGIWQNILPVRSHGGNTVYRLNRGQYNTALTFTLLYSLKAKSGE
jgi:hypothetical protein